MGFSSFVNYQRNFVKRKCRLVCYKYRNFTAKIQSYNHLQSIQYIPSTRG